MIKITALALFIALCNAEDIETQGASSRLLLQTGANTYNPYQQPATYNPYAYNPYQQQATYNPYGNVYNPYGAGQQLPSIQQFQAQNPCDYTSVPTHYNSDACLAMSMMLLSQYQQPQPQVQPPAQVPGPDPLTNPGNGPVTIVDPTNPAVIDPAQTPIVDPVVDPVQTPIVDPANPAVIDPVQTPANYPPANNGANYPPANNGANPIYPIYNPQPLPVTPPGHHAVGVNLPGIGAAGVTAGPLTEINCGPAPPAILCQNRRSGPGGSPLGPLNINGGASGLANQFKLYCDTPMACSGSEINIDLLPGGFVQQINQLLFSESQSGAQSTVNIRNSQGNGNNVELSELNCAAPSSCTGLTVNGWGVALNDVNCPYPGHCAGCKWNNYKTIPDALCPRPMDPSSIGNPSCIIETAPCFGF